MTTIVDTLVEDVNNLSLNASPSTTSEASNQASTALEPYHTLTLRSAHGNRGGAGKSNALFLSSKNRHVRTSGRKLCDDWNIPEKAALNMAALASGRKDWPVILLQNACRGHDNKDFDTMVKECATLSWIKDFLEKIGLSIHEVIILDMCPLLDDGWLEQAEARGPATADKAVKDAYELTEKLLSIINPQTVICCQCCTTTTKSAEDLRGSCKPAQILVANATPLAEALCSTMQAAVESQRPPWTPHHCRARVSPKVFPIQKSGRRAGRGLVGILFRRHN